MKFAFDIARATLSATGVDYVGWTLGITLGRVRIEFWFGQEDC